MKSGILLLLLSIITSAALAQPAIQWQRSLGGTNQDYANCIRQTTDSGYIVAGYTFSGDGDVTGFHGSSDYWVARLSKTGALLWQKAYGGSSGENANAIQQTTDGGYIVAGYSMSTNGDVTGNHGGQDYWVVKLDNAGAIQWQKSFGGTFNDNATSVQQTADGGYIVAGYSGSYNGDITTSFGNNDFWIIKLTSTGSLSWQKSFGGAGDDQAWSVQQALDGGYIVAGKTDSSDHDVTGVHGDIFDYWVIKISAAGALQWQKALGGYGYTDCAHSTNGCDNGFAVCLCNDTGYIVAGASNSITGDVTGLHGGFASGNDAWIVKLSKTGSLIWQRCLGGSGTETARSVQPTSDGGYIIGGGTNGAIDGDVTANHSGTEDLWIIKVNDTGAIQWQKSFGGTSSEDIGFVHQTLDLGYIVASGSASNDGDVSGNHGGSDFWIVKLGDTVYSVCDTVAGLSAAVATTTAVISWTAVPGAISYEYAINNLTYPPFGSGTVTTLTSAGASGLTPGLIYYAHVRTYCGHGNYSPWITIAFNTSCDTISALSVSSITVTGATLSWASAYGAIDYQYVVNNVATAPSGAGADIGTTSIAVTGLTSATLYYGHVRDSCSDGHFSPWATIPFTTMSTLSANNAQVGDFHLVTYPNPVTGILTIKVNGNIYANARIQLYGIAGNLLTCSPVTDNQVALDLSDLTAGIYLLRYSDAEHTQTIRISKR